MRYYAVLVKAESMEVLYDKVVFMASEVGPFVEMKRQDIVTVAPSTFPANHIGERAFEECCRTMVQKEAGSKS